MLAAIRSATLIGVQGLATTVEVHVGTGLPGLQIVGLPDEACRESRDRVRAAVLSSELTWPNQRITINLVPAGLRKGGSGLDLAIAIGVLAASEQINELGRAALGDLGFVGEVGLDGTVRAVPGVAPMVAALGPCTPVVARRSAAEAAAVVGRDLRAVANLGELVGALNGVTPWPDPPEPEPYEPADAGLDLADVRGQPMARRGLETAAAGGHHVLLVGPPGAGKTMLAQRLPGLLPDLDPQTARAATMVHSAIGAPLPPTGMLIRPPYCAPHHSSSAVSLIGGGSTTVRPGLISRAHGGVLFMDELGEFPASVLDSLRQPLEEGLVRISRANIQAEMPARFLLVGATNPCPCGGGPPGSCLCDDTARHRYLRRLSGPLLDRFDLRVAVVRPDVDDLMAHRGGESTAVVAARVHQARTLALGLRGMLNAAVADGRLDELIPVTGRAREMLRDELEHYRLTARGMHRIRRVARTLADLDAVQRRGDPEAPVGADHVALAMAMRVRLHPANGLAA